MVKEKIKKHKNTKENKRELLKKPKKIAEIVEIKAEVVKVEEVEGEEQKKEPTKMTYKQGKDFAIKKCASLISPEHKTYLLTHKKKDDLCDCYLQAYHYLIKTKKMVNI